MLSAEQLTAMYRGFSAAFERHGVPLTHSPFQIFHRHATDDFLSFVGDDDEEDSLVRIEDIAPANKPLGQKLALKIFLDCELVCEQNGLRMRYNEYRNALWAMLEDVSKECGIGFPPNILGMRGEWAEHPPLSESNPPRPEWWKLPPIL